MAQPEPIVWPEQGWQILQELDAYGADTFAPGDLPKLPYLEACLKEAMRLYPPGVFLIREPLTEDFHIQGYTIPKGTWIHVSLPHYLVETWAVLWTAVVLSGALLRISVIPGRGV